MRHAHHTESEILHLLVEAHAGLPVAEVCKTARISERTFYRWRSRYGGMTPTAAREIKSLQLEISRLRSLVASLSTRGVGDMIRIGAVVAPPRAEHGGHLGANASTGASLGRFAFVRGRR